jgi:spermidine synthase
MRKALLLTLLVLGINSILGQIIVIRELMVIFYGNELSLGIILAGWLLWTAAGSGFLARRVDSWGRPHQRLVICQLMAALTLPAAIWGIRAARRILALAPGEIVGLAPMFYTSLLVLAPLGLTLGLMFALGCELYSQATTETAASIGWAYLYEAIGASLGGVMFTYGLVFWFSHLQIALGLAVLNLLCGVFILVKIPQSSKASILTLIGLGLALFFIILSGTVPRWDAYLRRLGWPGFKLVNSRDSRYGNLTVVADKGQYSMFANGLLVFSYPDLLSAEEAVHFPLLEHPDPQRVLLISGGVGGALSEVLKHPTVSRVDYVELDPLIITLGRQVLPRAAWEAVDDPRVNIEHIDGRRWVNQTDENYDLILVNLPQPYTVQLNRFYTREFFEAAGRILSNNGIICLSFASSENYISLELAQFLASIYYTLKQVFVEVVALPGGTNFILGCKQAGILTTDAGILVSRLKERRLDTRHVREYYIPYRLSVERVEYLKGVLAGQSTSRINTDFSPISYYYDMLLWITNFSPRFKGLFTGVTRLKLIHWLGLVILLGLGFAGPTFFRGRKELGRRAVLFSVMSTGFAEITFEVVIILAFQIMFGYMYYKLGIILAGFMVGLALGSYLSTRWLERFSHPYRTFIMVQTLVVLYSLFLAGIFWACSRYPLTDRLSFWVEQLFPLLTLVAGAVGGFQFPLANKLYLTPEQAIGHSAGITYSIDLAGSCLGAAVVSTLLLPLLGVFYTCAAVCLLNVVALLLLLPGRG